MNKYVERGGKPYYPFKLPSNCPLIKVTFQTRKFVNEVAFSTYKKKKNVREVLERKQYIDKRKTKNPLSLLSS